MNIDIRKSIINNFTNSKSDEIKASITSAIKEKDEVTLPGMGVFFELLWKHSDDSSKEYILNTLETALKK